MNPLESLFGANWKARVSTFGTIISGGLTFLAGISYDVSPLALIMPPEWKPKVLWVSGLATCILWAWNGMSQKANNVTGGTVRQGSEGRVIAKGSADVSNLPEYFEIVDADGNFIARKATKDATPNEMIELKKATGIAEITRVLLFLLVPASLLGGCTADGQFDGRAAAAMLGAGASEWQRQQAGVTRATYEPPLPRETYGWYDSQGIWHSY